MGIKELGRPLGNALASSFINLGAQGDVGTITTKTNSGSSSNEVLADGRQLLKSSFPKLYSAIGDAYSSADFTAGFVSTTMASSSTWNSIAYGNGVFVAISVAGVVNTSSDGGITWVVGGSLPAGSWRSITYGNGRFVATASGTLSAVTLDGSSWTSGTLPSSQAWNSIAYGNGVFVTLGSSSTVAATSPDGITWTARTLPTSASWNSIAYGNGVFIVTNSTGGLIWTRTGVTWFTIATATNLGVLCFAQNVFVLSTSASSASMYTSSYGIFEDGFTSLTVPTALRSAIAYGSGCIVSITSGSSAAIRANINSATNFNIPVLIPLDNKSNAYIRQF